MKINHKNIIKQIFGLPIFLTFLNIKANVHTNEVDVFMYFCIKNRILV